MKEGEGEGECLGEKAGEGEGEGGGEVFFDCLICGEVQRTEDLYVLERCGHFFCPRCLYTYARSKLGEYREKQKEEKEKEKEKEKEGEKERKKEIFEVRCPLPEDICGILISISDLKVGFRSFSQEVYEEQELVNLSLSQSVYLSLSLSFFIGKISRS